MEEQHLLDDFSPIRPYVDPHYSTFRPRRDLVKRAKNVQKAAPPRLFPSLARQPLPGSVVRDRVPPQRPSRM